MPKDTAHLAALSSYLLDTTLADFIAHYHAERNYQGKGNALLFPSGKIGQNKPRSPVRCRERLDGLLRYYNYAA